jgi:hypothetical protein
MVLALLVPGVATQAASEMSQVIAGAPSPLARLREAGAWVRDQKQS